MKIKKDFQYHWERLCAIVQKKGKISDVLLMMELGFTPTAWKIWRPKFKELAETAEMPEKPHNGIKNAAMVDYDEESKTWNWILLPDLDSVQ